MAAAVFVNRETGEIQIQAKGTTYRLIFNTTAMLALEDAYSTPEREVTFEDAFNTAVSSGRIHGLRKILWCMSREHHPELVEKDLNAIIDAAGGVMGLGAVLEAARASASPDKADAAAVGVNGQSANPPTAQGGKATRRGGAISTSTRVASA